ncbi:MAG: heavy metal translocating P-type ATPase [Clostridiaceae bacterium]
MKKTFDVGGMDCVACAQSIERVLKKQEGVDQAVVNYGNNKLYIDFQEDHVTDDLIRQKVGKLGFSLTEDAASAALAANQDVRKKQFTVEGMDCVACAQSIERSLGKKSGVDSAVVNYASGKLYLSYNPAVIKTDEVEAAVKKLGFELTEDQGTLTEVKIVNPYQNRLIISSIFAIPLLVIAMGPMLGMMLPDWMGPDTSPLTFVMIQLILAIPVVYMGRRFYTTGFSNLFRGNPSMDTLIALGTSAAFLFSTYQLILVFQGQYHAVHSMYFESAAVILTLITLGKYLEHISKGKTSQAIKKLMGLRPDKATIIRNGVEVIIPIDDLTQNDIVVLKPGSSAPADGVVLQGSNYMDESMLTGESLPLAKTIDSSIYAASISSGGTIQYKATKVGNETALASIIRLVEDAQATKAPIAKLADIISGYFVPVVIVLAILSAVFWMINGKDAEFAITVLVSILVIACPCALGLATPTAIMVGTGKGAENGILIKSGEALEQAHNINAIVLDKTGTLTKGKPVVTDLFTDSTAADAKDHLLKLAASLEVNSEHPLGRAMVDSAKLRGIELYPTTEFKSVTGMGISAVIQGQTYGIGNEKLMKSFGAQLPKSYADEAGKLAEDGKTPMFVNQAGQIVGIIAVADTIKETSKAAVALLKSMGIRTIMLTGDNEKTARAIGRQLDIDEVVAEVLPEDKIRQVEELKAAGYITAMVGDGINDAPALAAAHVGIAIGNGTDVAMESADIVLMHDDIMDVPTAIDLSRKTIRNIKQNLFWAFIYNVVGIPIAMGIPYLITNDPNWLLNPVFAALAMSMSSVSVLTNALRLRGYKAPSSYKRPNATVTDNSGKLAMNN